jgi:16S rRNA (guanine527-N7)-methyltransferase
VRHREAPAGDERIFLEAVARLLPECDVSRETLARLKSYVALLLQWQERINLISPTTIPEIWTRHILDSMQLLKLKPQALHWLDLGSGGGLPGLVIGCFLAGSPGGVIHLVESNGNKAAFLRHVATSLALPVQVHADRIENTLGGVGQPEIVTARALAPLTDLIGYTNLLLKSGAIGLFPKGRDAEEELTAARGSWHFSSTLHRSVTDSAARIIEISIP